MTYPALVKKNGGRSLILKDYWVGVESKKGTSETRKRKRAV